MFSQASPHLRSGPRPLLLLLEVVRVEEGCQPVLALSHYEDCTDHTPRPPRPPREEPAGAALLHERTIRLRHRLVLFLGHVALQAGLDGIERVAQRRREHTGAARAKEAA
eukprot:scaffold34_cov62-Phaeocystis_antarctica.AAC.11